MKTLVALSTPPMNGAIHIVRLSGDDAFLIINKITSSKILRKGYQIQKTNIVDKKVVIDHVLINTFVKPKSFTGEDVVEINCHGGIYLARKIIQLLISKGCIMAQPGEFLQRAYMNNKLSIHEAEAINNLINATNDNAIKLANNGLNATTIKKLDIVREQLFKLIGQVEVNIDYPEFDDVPQITLKKFNQFIDDLIKTCTQIINDSTQVIPLRDGVNVAIIGKPNVGKSSLLNAFVKNERAIVSKTPGTTRDVISEKINLEGITINLLDTAGYRQTKHAIEKQGVNKTLEAITHVDLILFVADGSKPLTQEDKDILKLIQNKPHIVIINKSDLPYRANLSGVKVSAKESKINNLIKQIKQRFQKSTLNINQSVILQSNRSIGLMQNVVEELQIVKSLLKDKQPIDLSMEHLHGALDSIHRITGHSKEYNFIDELFRKFCVGK
ncbi:MAG: tRNA uridine-5-carboxymethylaminomethyl(34) synthesis GTPase MnmE [Mycoplasmataceae bacterium]|jgi:tRNA modification GTPase|nr:tRNA uridine-5-carboxymethylaminomethyl(34) synthesis GTPase MnmE [Mycoplasmataceae bacterium]